MGAYSIRDLERITGIKSHTIRIWEQRYQVVNPSRTETNIRHYCDDDLRKLLSISILNRNGYKISRIASMPEEEIRKEVLSIALHDADHDARVDGMVMAMVDLCEHKFESIMNSAIKDFGFQETFVNIIYPFMQKIGFLWLAGTIIPAQEHFISNLVRQKIITAIDGLKSETDPSKPVYLLFLPDWELHEMGLLFYQYLLKKEGYGVIYLGQMVPVSDLKEIVASKDPDVLLTILTTRHDTNALQTYIDTLSSTFKTKKIRIDGIQMSDSSVNLPANITRIENPKEFMG